SVPKQYIQSPQELFNFDSTKTKTHDSIPIIDFLKWDDPEAAQAICEATAKWGFFQIINHSIPIEVLEDLKAIVHRFFELPAPKKRKYLRDSPSATVRLTMSFYPKAE
ncbi:Non-heme dioxygenase N-terminal domain containing protein, partial [Parasponia andersonii]